VELSTKSVIFGHVKKIFGQNLFASQTVLSPLTVLLRSAALRSIVNKHENRK